MPDLSGMPSVGPTLPAGCTNVKVKTTAPGADAAASKVDVTVLSDVERVYQAPPLNDVDANAVDGVTTVVTCSFFGTAPTVDDADATGWVCTDAETEYSTGEFIKGTATFEYRPPAV
jgi:hypothetical protein